MKAHPATFPSTFMTGSASGFVALRAFTAANRSCSSFTPSRWSVEYADDRRRIFAQNKIPPRYFDCLVAALGSDFPARISADADLIGFGAAKNKTATRAKIADACARIEAQDAFSAALRKCGVAEPTVAALIAKHPDGLARLTAYDLIDYSLLDEDRPRGPRRGLTGGEADKLAQSEYALSFRPFDPPKPRTRSLSRRASGARTYRIARRHRRVDLAYRRRSGEAVRVQEDRIAKSRRPFGRGTGLHD